MQRVPDITRRHARLFELIRQGNLAMRQRRRRRSTEQDVAEVKTLVRRAGRSLER
ncbi:hypothetical protein [Roseovarius salis]|uniref:hypothetical protein n=1 Tax=Roseovarius salis TaxID=3376063 RepID=UPI0037C9C5D6